MPEQSTISLEAGWLVLLKDLGIEPANVLRRANLPLDLFARDAARIRVDHYFRMWNALEAEASDPTFTIRLTESIAPEAFHPPVFAALCSPNLAIAAKRIAEYKRLIAPMTLIVEERDSGFFVGPKWDDPSIHPPASLAAVELTFHVQIVRIATRERIVPTRVVTPYPMQPEDAYETYFGIRPEHGEEHGVTFRAEDAQRPFLTASEAMWDTFEPELRRRLSRLDAAAPLAERIRSVLLEGLPSGETSIDVTARRLGLSSRTLQRRLKLEDVTYKDIVRQTREKLARHYVTNTKLAYAEISFLIGFEEPGSFFRAFRESTGETPESLRTTAGA